MFTWNSEGLLLIVIKNMGHLNVCILIAWLNPVGCEYNFYACGVNPHGMTSSHALYADDISGVMISPFSVL